MRSHIRHVAAYLRHMGHMVTVVTSASAPVDEPGILVVGAAFTVPLNGSVARLNYLAPRLRQMATLALGDRSDVVHVHEPPVAPLTMACTLAARAARILVVGTFHSAGSLNAAWLYDLARPVLPAPHLFCSVRAHRGFASGARRLRASPSATITPSPMASISDHCRLRNVAPIRSLMAVLPYRLTTSLTHA
jgi:hypothetical protein